MSAPDPTIRSKEPDWIGILVAVGISAFILGAVVASLPLTASREAYRRDFTYWRSQALMHEKLYDSCKAGLDMCSLICAQKAARLEAQREEK